MKHMKVVLAVMLMLTTASAFSKKSSDKEKEKIVYAFGVSASFVDTVVYYTGIHVIDSVSLDKEGFLPTRELYSYQLKEFVEKEYAQKNSTSMIYFADKKKKIDKEYSKLMAKYKKNKDVTLKEIPADKFKFKKPDLGEE
jgi:hypothetical protein